MKKLITSFILFSFVFNSLCLNNLSFAYIDNYGNSIGGSVMPDSAPGWHRPVTDISAFPNKLPTEADEDNQVEELALTINDTSKSKEERVNAATSLFNLALSGNLKAVDFIRMDGYSEDYIFDAFVSAFDNSFRKSQLDSKIEGFVKNILNSTKYAGIGINALHLLARIAANSQINASLKENIITLLLVGSFGHQGSIKQALREIKEIKKDPKVSISMFDTFNIFMLDTKVNGYYYSLNADGSFDINKNYTADELNGFNLASRMYKAVNNNQTAKAAFELIYQKPFDNSTVFYLIYDYDRNDGIRAAADDPDRTINQLIASVKEKAKDQSYSINIRKEAMLILVPLANAGNAEVVDLFNDMATNSKEYRDIRVLAKNYDKFASAKVEHLALLLCQANNSSGCSIPTEALWKTTAYKVISLSILMSKDLNDIDYSYAANERMIPEDEAQGIMKALEVMAPEGGAGFPGYYDIIAINRAKLRNVNMAFALAVAGQENGFADYQALNGHVGEWLLRGDELMNTPRYIDFMNGELNDIFFSSDLFEFGRFQSVETVPAKSLEAFIYACRAKIGLTNTAINNPGQEFSLIGPNGKINAGLAKTYSGMPDIWMWNVQRNYDILKTFAQTEPGFEWWLEDLTADSGRE